MLRLTRTGLTPAAVARRGWIEGLGPADGRGHVGRRPGPRNLAAGRDAGQGRRGEGQDRLQAKRAGDRTGLQSLEPSNRMRLQRSIGCLREAPYLCGRATQAWQARDWRRCNTTRCQEPRQGPTNTEAGVAGARLFLWLEDHERGRQLPCKTRGLTFELSCGKQQGARPAGCNMDLCSWRAWRPAV